LSVAISDNGSVKVIFSRAALRNLPDLPKRDRAALIAKIAAFANDPFRPAVAVHPIKGKPHAVRIRQGDWRAVCRIDRSEDTIIVELVGNRREIYR
jgi:mRNA-degrading endonuclease RelE of RelBE toxin-antitoxin system